MNAFGLLLRSLLFYWRTNLAVLLGVVAGTAVIGGALLVGDSVRDSLARMNLERLGKVDHALHGQTFFREQLADDLQNAASFGNRFESVAPLLIVQGSIVRRSDDGDQRRVGGVTVYGVDERAWELLDHGDLAVPEDDAIVVNTRVAGDDQLGASAGDDVSLIVAVPKSIPGESLFGKREGETAQLELNVASVLPDDRGASRLSLTPSQQLPAVAFVGLDRLQRALEINEVRDRRTREITSAARVNGLFVAAKDAADGTGPEAVPAAKTLTELVGDTWTAADLRLHVRPYSETRYVTVESEAMILDDTTGRAAEDVAAVRKVDSSTVLVYLANQFTSANDDEKFSRYGVVAGIDFASEPPFGPFEYVGDPPTVPLGEREIVLNDWLAEDLDVSVGDTIWLAYHVVGSHGELPEEQEDFTVAGIVKLDGTRADDRGFTPVVKGVTDVESYDDWERPFEMEEVTDRDDTYWDRYRATPKAFVSLKAARDLWRSRYGEQTSVRIAVPEGETAEAFATDVTATLLDDLDPAAFGLAFRPVKLEGLQAASGTTPFAVLFIAFSFFLILSATILIALLFGLGVESRATQIGLLEAIGQSPREVRRLFLGEALVVVTVGGLVGTGAAVGYAGLMMYGLRTWWRGAVGTRFLFLSVHPTSLLIGFAVSVAITMLAVWWSLWRLRRLSARALLHGSIEPPSKANTSPGTWPGRVASGSVVVAGLLLAGVLTGLIRDDVEAFGGFSIRVVAFFLVGALLLTASITGLSFWLASDRSAAVRGAGVLGTARLGGRNAARHRQRSVFTVGLIASATFVIVAVAAGRQDLTSLEPRKSSGNGGYLLVAEADRGILFDLNREAGPEDEDPAGREALGFPSAGPEAELLREMQVAAFRRQPGEDASCLNLYQTRLPTILGAPRSLIEDGGFAFADTPGENPWTLLDKSLPEEDGVPVYPVLGDMNTLQYSLHVAIGGTIGVPNDDEPEYKLRVVGQFAGSVFQGVLVMSAEDFGRLHPDRTGYEYFLVGGRTRDGKSIPVEKTRELATLLETRLEKYGFDTEPIGVRLTRFLAVQNTYLETFRSLGALGLLLGTLGLSTVMLRNVLERRSELALLRAVGFRNGSVAWIVAVENAFLLVCGLVAGSVSALLSMLPQLRSTGSSVPWWDGGVLLGSVFAVGMLAALAAVLAAVRTPIVRTLRGE